MPSLTFKSCFCSFLMLISVKVRPKPIHCENKLVVLTTEWLPWLQANWRDSGNERFTFGNED